MESSSSEKGKKREVVVESLGWLTESSILPKKHKAIEGVGASSILELKAQLYKSQEDSKKSKELSSTDLDYHRRPKPKPTPKGAFSAKNSGVEARAHLDKLALKAVNEGAASYAALEKKAELYEKLVRGELSDEEDKEKYCVDFFRKGSVEDERQEPQNNCSSTGKVSEEEPGEEDAFIAFNSKPVGLGRTNGNVDLNEHKRFVKEVHEEANQAREKVSEIKLRRQQQEAARRQKLKQAYLKKQLEKLKAAATTKQDQT